MKKMKTKDRKSEIKHLKAKYNYLFKIRNAERDTFNKELNDIKQELSYTKNTVKLLRVCEDNYDEFLSNLNGYLLALALYKNKKVDSEKIYRYVEKLENDLLNKNSSIRGGVVSAKNYKINYN